MEKKCFMSLTRLIGGYNVFSRAIWNISFSPYFLSSIFIKFILTFYERSSTVLKNSLDCIKSNCKFLKVKFYVNAK